MAFFDEHPLLHQLIASANDVVGSVLFDGQLPDGVAEGGTLTRDGVDLRAQGDDLGVLLVDDRLKLGALALGGVAEIADGLLVDGDLLRQLIIFSRERCDSRPQGGDTRLARVEPGDQGANALGDGLLVGLFLSDLGLTLSPDLTGVLSLAISVLRSLTNCVDDITSLSISSLMRTSESARSESTWASSRSLPRSQAARLTRTVRASREGRRFMAVLGKRYGTAPSIRSYGEDDRGTASSLQTSN